MNFRLWLCASILLLVIFTVGCQAETVTPLQWLQAQPAPDFAPNTTLPALSRWGWSMSYDVAQELADRWGYAVEFSGYVSEKVADDALANPDSRNGKCLALVTGNPQKYKLAVLVDRAFPQDMVPEAFCRDAEGNFIPYKFGPKCQSPLMPQSVLDEAGRLHAIGLAKLHQRVPVSVILNGGEYGLNVLGFNQKAFEQDPHILAAKGGRSWYELISRAKAREQQTMADAIRAVCPDRQVYVYYPCGGDTNRNAPEDTFIENWGWDFKYMRQGTDVASNSLYYRSGWVGKSDPLTRLLAATGYEIKYGVKNSYDWVCAGYAQDKDATGPPLWDASQPLDPMAKNFSDLRLYEGFLKCLYTKGMLGGIAGYFSYPKGGFDAPFSSDKPPHWLAQMVVLSRVHALFSHHEAFLRQGDLLPGPDKHARVSDQWAYEFPTGNPNLRVLARALPDQPQWLITAWAADGVEGPATVEIPDLGSVTLQARAVGSVYTATLEDGKPVLNQVDATAPTAA